MKITRLSQYLRDIWQIEGHGELQDLSGILLVTSALGTVRYRDLVAERRSAVGAGANVDLGFTAIGTVPDKQARWVRYWSVYLTVAGAPQIVFVRVSNKAQIDIDIAVGTLTTVNDRILGGNVLVPEGCNFFVHANLLPVGDTLQVDSQTVLVPIGEELPLQS